MTDPLPSLPTTLPPSAQLTRPVPGGGWIDAAVRKEIDGVVPPTATAAAVLVGDLDGVRVALMAKHHWNGEWTCMGYFSHSWSGENIVGARLAWHNGD